MRQATAGNAAVKAAGNGHRRGTAARCLRTLLLAVCAVLAVTLHHTMPSAADPMPAMAHGAMAMAPAPSGASTPSGAPALSGVCAAGHHDDSGGAACPQAHCTAPDVRLSDFTPPVLPPAAGPCGADGTALAGPPSSAPAAGPAPPGPAGLCVLRI